MTMTSSFVVIEALVDVVVEPTFLSTSVVVDLLTGACVVVVLVDVVAGDVAVRHRGGNDG